MTPIMPADGTQVSYNAIAMCADNSIITTGGARLSSPDTGTGIGNFATLKYDANGHEVWRRYYEGRYPGEEDRPTALALLPDGSAVITGQAGSGETNDILTVAYPP